MRVTSGGRFAVGGWRGPFGLAEIIPPREGRGGELHAPTARRRPPTGKLPPARFPSSLYERSRLVQRLSGQRRAGRCRATIWGRTQGTSQLLRQPRDAGRRGA